MWIDEEQNELPPVLPHVLLDGVRADLGNLPIHHAREFVHHDGIG